MLYAIAMGQIITSITVIINEIIEGK